MPCAQDTSADCATLTVPVDWSDPDGPQTTIALARHRAQDPAAKVGALVVNPGGPGLSGVQMVTSRAQSTFSQTLLRRFDLIGFDPRGIGANPPVSCGTDVGKPVPEHVAPRNQAEFNSLMSYDKALLNSCRATTGPLADHMSGADVARDVEAVRLALGGQPLNWYGTSYGTEIGQRYAELFGNHIRAMVLDAVIDHTKPALTHLYGSTASAEDTFDRYSAWCRSTPTCPLHGQDSGAVLDEVMRRAADHPLQLHGTGYTADRIRSIVYLDLYTPSQGWPNLAQGLAALRSAPATNAKPDPVNHNQSTLAAICLDWDYTEPSYRDMSTVLATAHSLAPHLGINDVAGRRLRSCQGWPVTDPPHPLRVNNAPAVLLVNSEHDPMTPYTGAVDVSRQIPGSVLLTYDGDGHTTYTQSACIRDRVDNYLINLVTPAPNTHCPES
ncbi:MAG: alpha/beta fold hydrolase [Pseudonocardiales bacterium]|nr:alpha/beta fold hydrolase [Pseudonocardiales bacterium]